MRLVAKAAIQIQKPIEEVFEAIVDPAGMTQYFISESSGRLEEGREIQCKFAEFPDFPFPVNQIRIEKYKMVSFVWDKDTRVTILLEEQPDGSVVVKVEEDGKEMSEENIQWALGNTEGWAIFLAFMKAYVEYGINLRKGAFDFMRGQVPGEG